MLLLTTYAPRGDDAAAPDAADAEPVKVVEAPLRRRLRRRLLFLLRLLEGFEQHGGPGAERFRGESGTSPENISGM